MRIELTEEQRKILANRVNGPVEVVDPGTQRSYVLLSQEQFDRVRDLIPDDRDSVIHDQSFPQVPPGIRKSQEALRRDLPELLKNKRLHRQWIAYHGDERIGIARNETTLLRECLRRGLRDDSYYIGWISPTELIEVEEIEDPKPEHFDSDEAYLRFIKSGSFRPNR